MIQKDSVWGLRQQADGTPEGKPSGYHKLVNALLWVNDSTQLTDHHHLQTICC